MVDEVDQGVEVGRCPSGPGCQPSASAASASSQRGIPNADDESANYARLSNGMPFYTGSAIDAYTKDQMAFVERMIAAGHVPVTDDEGAVSLFHVDHGFCNGPGCSVCGEGVCMHCRPDWEPGPCPGAEAVEAEARARREAKYLALKAEFEPASLVGEAETPEARP